MIRIARVRMLALLCWSLALPFAAAAQTELTSWTIPSDHPAFLGQAQLGRVCVSENDISSVRLHETFGGWLGSFSPGIGGNDLYVIETTDDSLVVAVPGNIGLYKYSRSGLLQREVYFSGPPAQFVGRLAPLLDGQVLVAFATQLQIFDRTLTPIGSIPKVLRNGSPGGTFGMARRTDGSIVCCEGTNLGAFRLVAYGPGGGVLWDVPIPAGGSVACGTGGSIYVHPGGYATSLDVYTASGAPAGSWQGPPGSPLYNIVDITASPSGDLLFTLSNLIGGPVRVFSELPSPSRRRSWGGIKSGHR